MIFYNKTIGNTVQQNLLSYRPVNWYSKQICRVMSSVYSLSTTIEITFILPKLDLKKPTKQQLNFSLLCVENWATFHHYFFSLIIPKIALQKRSIIYYYLLPLITDLSYPKVHYKSVLLSSKNVALCNLTSIIIPKSVF